MVDLDVSVLMMNLLYIRAVDCAGLHRFRRGVRSADLVHRPRGPSVRGSVPASSDPGGGNHGFSYPGREVLPGRDHRRRAHHRGALPRALGQERGEGAPRQGRGHRRRGCSRHRRQERKGVVRDAAPAASVLHLHNGERLIIHRDELASSDEYLLLLITSISLLISRM